MNPVQFKKLWIIRFKLWQVFLPGSGRFIISICLSLLISPVVGVVCVLLPAMCIPTMTIIRLVVAIVTIVVYVIIENTALIDVKQEVCV